MRALFLDCEAGATKELIISSLTSLLDDPKDIERMIADARIPGVTASTEIFESSGTVIVRVDIVTEHEEVDGHHHVHRNLADVISLIDSMNVSSRVKEDAMAIYELIANAESQVHKEPVDVVHFHEVGSMGAIASIVGVCMLIERLAPEMIVSSQMRTGYGKVQCAHGLLPIPAPATAILLDGLPTFAGDEEGEFCTPTGAAMIKHFTSVHGNRPSMSILRKGYGLGNRKLRTNLSMESVLGETE